MNRFSFDDHPNYRVKQPNLLYIDRYGNIYPDCKTYKTPVLCHITDKNAVDLVREKTFGPGASGTYNMITVEVSSACQANCLYCFQRDAHRNDKYAYYDYLLPFLDALDAYWVFFSGGEILIQKDAMEFMRSFRKANPAAWIHLKTNGNADESAVTFVSEVCNSVMVSFNGFSPTTYETIMGLKIDKTKMFCEAVKKQGRANLGLKLLNSPITISETPEFLEWAFSLKPKCIALQNAFNYEVEPSGKSSRLSSTLPPRGFSLYWDDVYEAISARCDNVLNKHRAEINGGCNYLTADRDFLQLLSLSSSNMSLFRTDGVYIIE